MRTPKPPFQWLGLITVLAVALALGLAFLPQQAVLAQSGNPPAAQPTPRPPPSNAACLGCHSRPGMYYNLPDGDAIAVTIDPTNFLASTHNEPQITCNTCHLDITGYPHPKRTAKTQREYALMYKDTCKVCHQTQYNQVHDSIHYKELSSGNLNAPECTDCHNPHTQTRLKDTKGRLLQAARVQIPRTCARCHNTIYEEYAKSVHGTDLLTGDNPDVPACVGCHSVHNIQDPTTEAFRLSSPNMCSNCHTDESIMSKYKISTQVLTTYLADFHGTTVTLFAKRNPNERVNMPVCYDCHGVHNIMNVNDPQKGLAIKKNMQAACQSCHPDANISFPDSWLSHYIPSPDRAPLVYYIQLFYILLTVGVIGGMLLFVLSDAYRRFRTRSKHASAK